MKQIFIISIMALVHQFGNSQIDLYSAMSIAINEDSLGYYQELQEVDKSSLIVLKDGVLQEGKKDITEYFKNIRVRIFTKNEYEKFKKKKEYPIIYLEKISIKSDVIILNIHGASYEYKKKGKNSYFVFSDLLITYKFNCETKEWELASVEDINI